MFKLIVPFIFVLGMFNGCKTTSKSAMNDEQLFSKEVESISCTFQHSADQNVEISIYPSMQWQTNWTINNKNQQASDFGSLLLSKNPISYGKTDFTIKDNRYTLSVANSLIILTSETRTSICTQIFASSTIKEKPPTCNSIGTSAQGWYRNGKLLTYSKTCQNESLSCAASNNEGWYTQAKVSQVEISKESCSWRKTRPSCQSANGITGWYLESRLISRDDSCSTKSIECSQTKGSEGWVTFSKKPPSLFVISPCTQATKKNLKVSSNR
jgi:hypothetical protein